MPRSSFNQLGTEANRSRIPPVAYLTDSLASNFIFSGFFNVFTYLCTRYLRDPGRGADGHDKGCLMVGRPSLVGRRAGQSRWNEKLPQDYSLGSGAALLFSCLCSKMKDSHFLTNRVRTQRMHFLISHRRSAQSVSWNSSSPSLCSGSCGSVPMDATGHIHFAVA